MSETRTGKAESTDPEVEADTDETTASEETDERVDDHLDGVDAGCGCAEVWETLSEQREE